MAAAFSGFGPADFLAYEEHKWASNRFNLERMRAREKLQQLAGAAAGVAGVDALGLGMEATHDHPTIFNHKRVDAQWVFFARPEAERKRLSVLIDKEHPLHRVVEDPAPHHLHAILGLRLDLAGLEVGLRIHRNAWVDVRNLGARCTSAEGRAALVALIAAVPGGVVCAGGPEIAGELVDDETLAPLSAGGEPETEWILVARRFDREDPLLTSPDLTTAVASTLGSLVPLYAFAAWREDNDHLGLVDVLAAERRRAEELRATAPRAIAEDARVRIIRGILSGHQGWVDSLDGMGGARVRLGTLTVQVMTRDLQLDEG